MSKHLNNLFSEHKLIKSEFLQVSDIHKIYLEEYGTKDGIPVIICHGGPGGGITPDMPRFFDPKKYRIIVFDQRGCGKSTPFAELKENTTWDLVADMEKIRKHKNIDKWVVFGGSWGSTLSLAYAQTHPKNCLGLILRGIFTLRKEEIDWTYQNGVEWIFPEIFSYYRSIIPKNERHDMVKAYYKRLTSNNKEEMLRAAKAWSLLEGTIVSLLPNKNREDEFIGDKFAEAFAKIECHYFINNGFFKTDGQLMDNCDKIAHLPTYIIHGRYDIITPIKSAWELHNKLPKSKLFVINDAGHAASEPGIIDALVNATEDMHKTLSK